MSDSTRRARSWADDEDDDFDLEAYKAQYGCMAAPTLEELGPLQREAGEEPAYAVLAPVAPVAPNKATRNWADEEDEEWDVDGALREFGEKPVPTVAVVPNFSAVPSLAESSGSSSLDIIGEEEEPNFDQEQAPEISTLQRLRDQAFANGIYTGHRSPPTREALFPQPTHPHDFRRWHEDDNVKEFNFDLKIRRSDGWYPLLKSKPGFQNEGYYRNWRDFKEFCFHWRQNGMVFIQSRLWQVECATEESTTPPGTPPILPEVSAEVEGDDDVKAMDELVLVPSEVEPTKADHLDMALETQEPSDITSIPPQEDDGIEDSESLVLPQSAAALPIPGENLDTPPASSPLPGSAPPLPEDLPPTQADGSTKEQNLSMSTTADVSIAIGSLHTPPISPVTELPVQGGEIVEIDLQKSDELIMTEPATGIDTPPMSPPLSATHMHDPTKALIKWSPSSEPFSNRAGPSSHPSSKPRAITTCRLPRFSIRNPVQLLPCCAACSSEPLPTSPPATGPVQSPWSTVMSIAAGAAPFLAPLAILGGSHLVRRWL